MIRKGFTLVEMLIGLFGVSLFLPIFVSLLRIMVTYQDPQIEQFEIFKFQFRQLLIRNERDLICYHDHLRMNEFLIELDRYRLVKRPGYEILLEDVESIHIDCTFKKVYIELSDGYKGSVTW